MIYITDLRMMSRIDIKWILQGLSCILRWYSNGDERWHALPAGFLAGISLHYFRSSTLVLYVIWRVIDVCVIHCKIFK